MLSAFFFSPSGFVAAIPRNTSSHLHYCAMLINLILSSHHGYNSGSQYHEVSRVLCRQLWTDFTPGSSIAIRGTNCASSSLGHS